MIDEARNILVNATRGEILTDACRVKHSSLGETVRITPYYPGFTLNGEYFQYVPMEVKQPSTVENLSQNFEIVIQDLHEVVGAYFDRIPLDTTEPAIFESMTVLIDRNNNVSLADGPNIVQIRDFTSEMEGVGFSAQPQATNMTKCGERGTIARTGGLYRQFA